MSYERVTASGAFKFDEDGEFDEDGDFVSFEADRYYYRKEVIDSGKIDHYS